MYELKVLYILYCIAFFFVIVVSEQKSVFLKVRSLGSSVKNYSQLLIYLFLNLKYCPCSVSTYLIFTKLQQEKNPSSKLTEVKTQ